MARPERNDVDYFPYLCKEGKAMFYIEQKYSNDGFATWIKILRQLAVTNYHYLNLNNKADLMILSAKCKVSEEILISIINDLVELGEFDKKLWIENRIIWNQKFIDSIQDAYKKRNNKCITYEGLRKLILSLGVCKQGYGNEKRTRNPQSKVKYTKVKESKEDFIDKIVDLFKDAYEKNFELPYEITNKGKEKGCAGKILKIYKDKCPEANSEETLKALEIYFNSCCQIEDNWLSQNMSLPIILNKFNEINKILRNGKSSKGATNKQLAEMLANKFGTDRKK